MLQLLETEGFGIVYDRKWQAVVLAKASPLHVARLGADKGKPLIYIDFIEIAPWNWVIPEIGQRGRFRALGSTLFRRAVKLSEEEGFHGRVGLHAGCDNQNGSSAVRGRLQRAGLVIHVVAESFFDLSAELPSLRNGGDLFSPKLSGGQHPVDTQLLLKSRDFH